MKSLQRLKKWTVYLSLVLAFLFLMPNILFAKSKNSNSQRYFQRIATFPVFLNTDVDLETVAEIVASAKDGNLLIYTDSETESIGFVDITDPTNPQPAGVVSVGGEPTAVAVKGNYALAAVNTSPDFVNPSGQLEVIDINSRVVVATIDLGGQPDSIAVSPDGRYAAIAIENERDEDLGNGRPPQAPPGFVVIVDLVGGPDEWMTRRVDLVGIPDKFPEDPEPEYVDINRKNVAAVTLQENNHLVQIDLRKGEVIEDWPLGSVDLEDIDILENELIELTGSQPARLREPDAVAWTGNNVLATADEGDLDGGSRGFTIFNKKGKVLFNPGNTVEHLVTRIGHYPEDRSENKGNEPEGVEYGQYGKHSFLFVGSERSSVVAVYELQNNKFKPRFLQVLPAGVGPEGLLAIPERNLFVVASEVDERDNKIRSTIAIYELVDDDPIYPTIQSADREDNLPIPWGALSALAADPQDPDIVYTVHDSFYRKSRIYTVDVDKNPAQIFRELELRDDNDVLIDALTALKSQLPGTDDFVPADAVNNDGTVNLDPEGIAVGQGGYFYVASEGSGNLVNGVSNPENRPFESPNVIVKVADNGVIVQAILLPLELTRNQLRFGLEGLAVVGDYLYVAFQREWKAADDPEDKVRIGRYNLGTGNWAFAYYSLDPATSPNGGWVGLSEITALGDNNFAVIERDNQGGPDASIKRIYKFSVAGVEFKPNADTPNFNVVAKSLVSDLILDDAYGDTGGLIPEKLEGLAALEDGSALIVNDNDGVDDNSGETQLLNLGAIFNGN
mgnify:CR=1 FL=1|jgi:hypothetical protein